MTTSDLDDLTHGEDHTEQDSWDSLDAPRGAVDDGDDDPDRELSTSVALFEGDEGRLDLAQRRALVTLLKQRFITAASHPREWRALVANQTSLRVRLNELFLDLHLDTDHEVAYKRPVTPEGGGRFPTLLHDVAWTREETILLVHLRSRSRAEQAAGVTRTFVDREDMLDHVASLRPDHATDRAADTKRAQRAIESLTSAGLLVGASTDDRFEVSPAIDVLLPIERLQTLLAWLRTQTTDEPGEPRTPADADRPEQSIPADQAAGTDQNAHGGDQ